MLSEKADGKMAKAGLIKSRAEDMKKFRQRRKDAVPVEGYEGLYEISPDGACYSFRREIFLKPVYPKNGYPLYALSKDGKPKTKTIHRLLAIAFIPNPNGKEYVNHLDGDKKNYSLDNLAWASPGENTQHAHKNGLVSYGHYQRRRDKIDRLQGEGFVFHQIWLTPEEIEVVKSFVADYRGCRAEDIEGAEY